MYRCKYADQNCSQSWQIVGTLAGQCLRFDPRFFPTKIDARDRYAKILLKMSKNKLCPTTSYLNRLCDRRKLVIL